MGEVWTIRPLKSIPRRTKRPVTAPRLFARIRSVNIYLDEVEFKAAFKNRLKRMREALPSPSRPSYMTQLEMAKALGVEGDDDLQIKNTYSKWEQNTSPNNFPMHLLPKLCEVTGHDPWYVLTEQAPAKRPKHRQTS